MGAALKLLSSLTSLVLARVTCKHLDHQGSIDAPSTAADGEAGGTGVRNMMVLLQDIGVLKGLKKIAVTGEAPQCCAVSAMHDAPEVAAHVNTHLCWLRKHDILTL